MAERRAAGRMPCARLVRGGPRPVVAAMAAVACALSFAACGSSHHSASGASGGSGASSAPGGSSGSASAAATTAAPTAAAGSAAPVGNDVAQRYIGGRPGRATGKPVRIGFVNEQGGPVFSMPEATSAAQVAVSYINDELGGVHGRPLALDTCFVVNSEEEGQACGERFAADGSVQVVAYPVITVGQQSLMTALQGKKPLISLGGQYTHPTNAYLLDSDLLAGAGAEVQYVLDVLKAKSVAMIVQGDSPAGVQSSAVVKKRLEQAGVKVRLATVQGSAPNVSSTLVSAGAQSADALMLGVDSPSLCIGVAEALPQLGLSDKPLVSAPTCVDPAIAKATGDMLKGTFLFSLANPLAPGLDPEVQLYEQVMKRYAPRVPANLLTAPDAFAVVMTVAKFLNATTSMTAAQISKEVAGYRGSIFMGQPKTDCGFSSSNPALCSEYSRPYTYEGHGKWTAGPWFAQTAIPWSSDR